MTLHRLLFLLSSLIAVFLQPVFAQQPLPSTRHNPVANVRKVQSFEQLSQSAARARVENRDDDAIGFYKQALKLQPAWQEGLWYLGTLLYQKELFSETRDVLRRFVAESPQSGPGWAILGMSEYKPREYSRALDHLQRAMSLGVGDRAELANSVFYFVSILRTRFEQYDESATLMMALARAGRGTDLFVEPLGLAALRLPLLPQEIPAERRDLVRLAGEGMLAVEARQSAEAERLYGSMVQAYPNQPGVHFLYGAFLMDVRPEDGIREMKRELEISPSHLGAKLRLAEEYVKEQRLDEALPLAEEAVKLEHRSALAHMILGEVLVARGDLAKGISELETARKQTPGMVRIHWDLLRAYASSGRAQDAKKEKDEIEKLGSSETRP
jgi:tetratricopeptide (TPR) repeat protein